jgi:hypothetical protein
MSTKADVVTWMARYDAELEKEARGEINPRETLS